MRSFILCLRSLFAWRLVRDTGVWAYWENTITGQRSVSRSGSSGYQPIDWLWLHKVSPLQPEPWR